MKRKLIFVLGFVLLTVPSWVGFAGPYDDQQKGVTQKLKRLQDSFFEEGPKVPRGRIELSCDYRVSIAYNLLQECLEEADGDRCWQDSCLETFVRRYEECADLPDPNDNIQRYLCPIS